KSRPPFGGVRRFASGCRFFFKAVNRPLVRIPANRHTTTGTCEIGQVRKYAILHALQVFFQKMRDRGSASTRFALKSARRDVQTDFLAPHAAAAITLYEKQANT